MNCVVIRRALVAVAVSLAATLAGSAAEQTLTVDGMEVFYGIMPAEIVRQTPVQGSGVGHRGRERKNARHLVVALFDAGTKQRIADASIVASVTPLGLASDEKRLEPMRIDGTITFGNFFDFPDDSGPFRIVLTIARPHSPNLSATFEYRP